MRRFPMDACSIEGEFGRDNADGIGSVNQWIHCWKSWKLKHGKGAVSVD
jgi:hypothetical protein